MPTASSHTETVRQFYNQHTDVLTIRWRDAKETVTDDTPSGFIVHYALPEDEAVAVTVLRYCRRFGAEPQMLHIDTPQPFDIAVQPLSCEKGARRP